MVKLSEIRALIDAYIKTNGNQEITGHTMNVLLNEIVRILDERKQDVLVSGENIKTIGGMSLLGEGDIPGYDDTEIRNLINAVVTAVEGQNGKIAEIAGSVQEQDKKLTEKEDKKNKVTSLSDESTDVQYPSAKIVYDLIKLLKERIEEQDQFIEDLQNTKIEKENDDYYPKMAVGLADNLAGVDVVESEINFRRSGGGAISDGVARIESIKGNSVVWNQVFKPNISAYGSQFVKIEDDGLTMEAIKEPSEKFLALYNAYMGIASHKYFLAFDVVSGSYTEGETRMEIFGNVVQPNVPRIIALSEEKKIGVTLREVGCVGMRFRVRAIDLTQMFGTSNEPTTIEEFYARIPMGVDMNAYNEGEVIHMDVQSIESQGVNAWDEEWENGIFNSSTGLPSNNANYLRSKNFFPVLPNTPYYATYNGSSLYIFWYDKDKNFIKNQGLYAGYSYTSPSNAAFAKFYTAGTTYNHDICINISDSAINGKYFPYIKRVEDLAVIRKYFPQGMKSAPTAHDAIRYNKESGKWEKVVATGIRAYQEGDADNAAYLTDGKVTCYPLAEPIVTELDEADQFKDLDYQVWNGGTEKANAEGKSAPLAADITYGFNAIGKIKELESLVAALRAKVGV